MADATMKGAHLLVIGKNCETSSAVENAAWRIDIICRFKSFCVSIVFLGPRGGRNEGASLVVMANRAKTNLCCREHRMAPRPPRFQAEGSPGAVARFVSILSKTYWRKRRSTESRCENVGLWISATDGKQERMNH